jgi:hypothetical protein
VAFQFHYALVARFVGESEQATTNGLYGFKHASVEHCPFIIPMFLYKVSGEIIGK